MNHVTFFDYVSYHLYIFFIQLKCTERSFVVENSGSRSVDLHHTNRVYIHACLDIFMTPVENINPI